jgi:sugar-phosphatase
MEGVYHVLELLKSKGFSIGLATSSPTRLIDVVVDKLNIRDYFSAFASAEHLIYGKPHPQVYIDCAIALNCNPTDCICFEDSFHGMIAAKAARMKCIVIPATFMRDESRWNAADLQLNSLVGLTEELLDKISR